MLDRRKALHAAFALSLPIAVAAFGLSVWSALLLVVLVLLWRWAIVLHDLAGPAAGAELVLETISASHFVEKVRWCMDRLGVEYTEAPSGGTLNAFYLGQSVPLLRFRTGGVRSSMGYVGCRTLEEMRTKAEFVRVTGAGMRESHVHDVQITKEAPNYRAD